MKYKIKSLMFLNLIFYINIISVVILTKTFGLEGIVALWFFTPIIFLMFTTSIVESSNKKALISVKKIAVLDFLLRVIVLLLMYVFINIELQHINLSILIFICTVFAIINIFLELKMYKFICNYTFKTNDIEETTLTNEEVEYLTNSYYSNNKDKLLANVEEKEKKDFENIYEATKLLGYSTYIMLFLYIGILLGFLLLGKQYRIITIFISFVFLALYFYFTNLKLKLFYYKNNKKCLNITLRDNTTFAISIGIICVLQGFVHIETGTLNILGLLFAGVALIPTISTNKAISSKFHAINKKHLKNKVS
ncbi:hypothetical protein RBH29_09760 [Herbivorax sp. ANBcel31]|uniref:hypothetical protein n=1 Tax=Herbivorax sp. ANBcel31 TaxID=3069754 RepID=UPI0027B6BF9C|nr:hypothetical protein [Herbivorax sp. ANBcel31]MDQ2086710.1 hypothetical protein [Herbivorax sp. ANBcel31]